MNIAAEKMGLDPEKLRSVLAQKSAADSESPAQPEAAGPGQGVPAEPEQEPFNFDIKPEELEAYLDQYVIEQREAKGILATKICTHFNRLSLPQERDEEIVGNIKNNVLMIGPTGVGKTFLIRLIAKKLGVPFVKGDATKFSETGYVGGDVEDMVRELVREADGSIDKAQCGIIYIDEIDKIASSKTTVGPDVSRSGVQRNLLKLMEETDVDLKAPHDIASQMESIIQMQQTGKMERKKINTRNILFIVSGAFSGLDEIVGKRLNRGRIGFRSGDEDQQAEISDEELHRMVRSDDLIEYGFESEFVGRLPVIAVLDQLTREDLFAILKNPKSNVIVSKKRDFLAYGIELEFEEPALRLLAERAIEEHIGARGLVSAIERVLIRFEKKFPSTNIRKLTVTAKIVKNPESSLAEIMEEHALHSYLNSFLETHGIKLKFTEAATEMIYEMSQKHGRVVDDLCSELFSDFGHGLKLVSRTDFEITPEVLEKPQQTLDDLIKRFYEPLS